MHYQSLIYQMKMKHLILYVMSLKIKMGVTDGINIKITGYVDADRVNVKRKVMAKLEAVCAEYDLDLEELY